jgi:hypothetical protein
MFAPQTMRATRFPRKTVAQPDRTARRWRPPPRLHRELGGAEEQEHGAAQGVVVDKGQIVDVAAAEPESCRGRHAARRGCRRWSAPPRSAAASRLAKLRCMESAPAGSTPNTRQLGSDILDRGSHPRAEPSTATGTTRRRGRVSAPSSRGRARRSEDTSPGLRRDARMSAPPRLRSPRNTLEGHVHVLHELHSAPAPGTPDARGSRYAA